MHYIVFSVIIIPAIKALFSAQIITRIKILSLLLLLLFFTGCFNGSSDDSDGNIIAGNNNEEIKCTSPKITFNDNDGIILGILVNTSVETIRSGIYRFQGEKTSVDYTIGDISGSIPKSGIQPVILKKHISYPMQFTVLKGEWANFATSPSPQSTITSSMWFGFNGFVIHTKGYMAFNYIEFSDNGNYNSNNYTLNTSDISKSLLSTPGIEFAKIHYSGNIDEANAFQNITDTANGLKAKRSRYIDNINGVDITGPGDYTDLNQTMLLHMLYLSKYYNISISEIAGGVHSNGSSHYDGKAFDVNIINGILVQNLCKGSIDNFIKVCNKLGLSVLNETSHLHIYKSD